MKRTRRKQNEKSEILGEREEKGGFWVFFLGCCDGGERCNVSLSLFSFAKNMYAHAHVFLAKKKGEID